MPVRFCNPRALPGRSEGGDCQSALAPHGQLPVHCELWGGHQRARKQGQSEFHEISKPHNLLRGAWRGSGLSGSSDLFGLSGSTDQRIQSDKTDQTDYFSGVFRGRSVGARWTRYRRPMRSGPATLVSQPHVRSGRHWLSSTR